MAMTNEQLSANEKFQEWAKKYKEEHPDAKDDDIFAVFRETKEFKDIDPKPEEEQKPEGEKPAEEKPAEEKPAEEKPEEGKPEGEKTEDGNTLNMGGMEDGKTDDGNGGAGRIPNFWKEWAEKKNYTYEDNDAGDYDYACTIYEKAEDKAAGKDPVVSVKAKGDTMLVKSDRLEVYQEIAKQAKEHGYTNVNFMDDMPENQQKLMLIACLEQGLKVSGKVPEYLPIKEGNSEELAAKINEYNILSFAKKYKGKEDPITLPEGDIDLKMTAFCGAVLSKAKISEDHQDFLPPGRTDVLKYLPDKPGLKKALTEAIEAYNHKSAENIFNETKTFADENKENADIIVNKINEEKNPHKKAMLWAYCKNNGIAADKLPDISEALEKTEKSSRYYPEAIKKTLAEQRRNKGNEGQEGGGRPKEGGERPKEGEHTGENPDGKPKPKTPQPPQPRGKPKGHEK